VATCTPEALADAATCYACLSASQLQAIEIFLLCNITNGTTMTCTPQALASAALSAGFDRMSETQMQAVKVLLLCTIANTGGGGGGGGVLQVFTYTGTEPTDPPTNPLSPAISYDPTAAEPVFYWNIDDQEWQ
jgi:hypothetical protein